MLEPMPKEQEQHLAAKWAECTQALTKAYSLAPTMGSDDFLKTDSWSEILTAIDTVRDDRESEALLLGYIASECFKDAFPSSGICKECISELSMEFARQSLDPSQERYWMQRWRNDESSGALKTTRFHKGSEMLPTIERVSGSRTFVEIVREVASASKSGLEVNFEEYSSYLKRRVKRITATLDSIELKIVDLLTKDQDADNISVASAVGISPEWASRKISDLQSRWILRRFDRVPFSKIGIRMFNLFISSEKSALEILNLLEDLPFLYSYQGVLTGSWNGLAVLSVPDNPKSIRLVESLRHLLAKCDLETLLLEIASSGVSVCFDHYDVSSKNWFLPWELLEVHLRRIYNDKLAHVIGMVDTPPEKMNLKLDALDMLIIDQMRQRNTSIAKIRTQLKIGQQKASDRVRRLREGGLIDTLWEVHNIGLIESVIISTEDVQTGEAIAAWALRLPRAIISFNADRHLSLVAQLPQGGSYGITRALSFLSHQVDVGLLDEKIYGGWGFPIELWDEQKHAWSYPEEKMNTWLASLEPE